METQSSSAFKLEQQTKLDILHDKYYPNLIPLSHLSINLKQ